MTALEVWPAIDLLGGRAVRLHKGRYDEVTVYDGDPAAIAARWTGRTPRLHVVDLEGARDGRLGQLAHVAAIAKAFGGCLQVGGGVRSFDAARAYVDAGAARVVLGTLAVESPDVARRFADEHPGTVVLAVDAEDGIVKTRGWLESSGRRAEDVVRSFDGAPLAAVLYTDIARDGTKEGPNVPRTAELAATTGRPVLASGGVGSLDHVAAVARERRITGLVVGKALHDGLFTLEDALRAAER